LREKLTLGLTSSRASKPGSAFSAFIRVREASPGIVSLALILAFLSLAPGCTFLFFNPGKNFVSDPRTRSYAPQDVSFKSADGLTLNGWYFRARGEERGTVFVCHGNVENISTHVKLDLWLIDAGYNLFIFDYRGYGKSEGEPDVKGINIDAEAALEILLTKLPRKKNDGVVVFGKSLGGAVAVYTVANSPYKNRVKALILDSAFSSYRRIAREKIARSIIGWPFQYPLSFLVNDDYSAVDYIGKITPIPVLIMQGYQDGIVPAHHGRILYNAALQPKEFWELTLPGHVKSWTDEATRKRLLAYLETLPAKNLDNSR
jgi:fermentation-respiration switch protein FrsA (DUF1100 family)